MRNRVSRLLPAGVAAITTDDNAALTARMSRSYRVNLNVLALVALFTGGLLVFSTQALSVVRRRAQFALLRTLGLSRGRLLRWLLAEGALVGIAGALAGVAGGYALARVALHFFGADLGGGYFRDVRPSIAFDVHAALAVRRPRHRRRRTGQRAAGPRDRARRAGGGSQGGCRRSTLSGVAAHGAGRQLCSRSAAR